MMWSIEVATNREDKGSRFSKESLMKAIFLGVSPLVLPLLIASCLGETQPPSEEQIEEAPSIAVLPFESLSSDSADTYISTGIHAAVIASLAKTPSLRVVSRTSVERYRFTMKPVSEIASELGVGYILEGAVRRSGERLRVTVQLLDAKSAEHLWAESFERDMSAGNLMALQRGIATRVAETIAGLLRTPESDDVQH